MTNKEYGSDFHNPVATEWCLEDPKDSIFNTPFFSLFFSGRAALYHLLAHGIEINSWKRVYFPSYYCHEVTAFIQDLPIAIHYYKFNPLLDSEIDFNSVLDEPSSVFVNVSFFGSQNLSLEPLKAVTVIDDITHDLLSFKNSTASFCFGSFRKELPVPLGGFCYSPKEYLLPEGIANKDSEVVAEEKISAMQLKQKYLEGEITSKELYRQLFTSSERKFEEAFTRSTMPEKAKQILFNLDVLNILKAKQNNIKTALKNLQPIKQLVFNLKNSEELKHFILVLFCTTTKQRDDVKNYLVAHSVFPAILWPDQLTSRDAAEADKVLCIHMDFRYSEKDILFITNLLKNNVANG